MIRIPKVTMTMPVEASILFVIGSQPGITQSDIGKVLGILRANMTPLVAALITQGLVERAAIAAGRIGSIVGPKLAGYLKSAGHVPSQLPMDLLPIVVAGSICALLLAWSRSGVRNPNEDMTIR